MAAKLDLAGTKGESECDDGIALVLLKSTVEPLVAHGAYRQTEA